MSIEQTLRKQLTEALKAKERRTADVIRMINTKVMERRTSKGFSGEVDDALYLEVIGAYKKTLTKALGEYQALGEKGAEEAEGLRLEAEFCAQFLPAPLDDDALRAAVREAIEAIGASDAKMSGRVVGHVMKAHKGRAEAADVKRIVAEELA